MRWKIVVHRFIRQSINTVMSSQHHSKHEKYPQQQQQQQPKNPPNTSHHFPAVRHACLFFFVFCLFKNILAFLFSEQETLHLYCETLILYFFLLKRSFLTLDCDCLSVHDASSPGLDRQQQIAFHFSRLIPTPIVRQSNLLLSLRSFACKCNGRR